MRRGLRLKFSLQKIISKIREFRDYARQELSTGKPFTVLQISAFSFYTLENI